MTHQLQPITITPEQIVAIAAVICKDQSDEDTQYTPEQWQAATEHWLRTRMNGLLVDVDWHARKDFEIDPICNALWCHSAALPHSIYCQHHSESAIEDGNTGRTVPLAPTVVPLETAVLEL